MSLRSLPNTVKNLPGRRGENSSKVGANGGNNAMSNIQRPEGQPGTVWGHGFNKYYMLHTKSSRTKAKEDTIVEENT